MSVELKDLEGYTPTLTFGASASELQMPAEVKTQETPTALEESDLTEEERKQVSDFAQTINLRDTQAVLEYGAGTQKKMADFSEKTLEKVRTKDLGETGKLLSGLVTELKHFDVDENEKGAKGFFKKKANQATSLKTKYNSVEKNVNEIVKVLENHQVTLLKDVDILDKMYDLNLAYFKEISMYILAGKQALEKARTTELTQLQNKAQQTGKAEDAEAAKDFAAMCDRFEKKIYDLELSRNIAIQSGPQIRMVQNSDMVMAEKIQSSIVNTIPLWKNRMVIALGIEHANQAAKAQREVSDMTNELLKQNAKSLQTAAVETEKESQRGIVDIETLRETNDTLIATLNDVMEIQKDGREKRKAAEEELTRIEDELRGKMLEIAQGAR